MASVIYYILNRKKDLLNPADFLRLAINSNSKKCPALGGDVTQIPYMII